MDTCAANDVLYYVPLQTDFNSTPRMFLAMIYKTQQCGRIYLLKLIVVLLDKTRCTLMDFTTLWCPLGLKGDIHIMYREKCNPQKMPHVIVL